MTQTASAEFGGTLAAAWNAFTLGVRRSLANWPILAGRSLFYLVAMTVLTALWDKVSSQRLAGTLALPHGGLALYVGVTEWITLSVASIHLRLEDDIRLGLLEPHLLRPKPYLLQKIAEAMGDSVARLLGLGTAALLALALSGRALPPAIAFLYIAVLGPVGTALGVLIYAGVGLAAFWVRRVLPPYIIVQKIWFLLGGLFAPISLYPAWFFNLAIVSPFAASIFMPGNMMIAPSATGFAEALVAQLAWLAALAGLVALIWRAGLRKILREGV
jgi:ABC-2 type transport system permease protein